MLVHMAISTLSNSSSNKCEHKWNEFEVYAVQLFQMYTI